MLKKHFLNIFVVIVISILGGCSSSIVQKKLDVKPLDKAFISEVPKGEFTNLTIKDFPSIRMNYNPPKALLYNGKIFLVSYPHVIQYDLSGNITGYTDWKTIDCAQDTERIKNFLYIACWGKGIYEVDLDHNDVTYLYTLQNGLPNLQNLQLAVDEETLWVGTFDGVAKISVKDHVVTAYRSELGVPGSGLGSAVYARGGDVWAIVRANAYNNGGAVQYDKSNNSWIPYGPKDFNENGSMARIDFNDFIVSDQGTYATFNAEERPVVIEDLKKFDPVEKKWNTVYRAAYEKFRNNIGKYLPPKETYTSFNIQFNGRGNLREIQILDSGAWMQIPVNGSEFLAISPVSKDTYYLLSNLGLYGFGKADSFPRMIASHTVYAGNPQFYITDDKKYVVFLSSDINEMAGGTTGYSIGVYNAENKKFFGKELRRNIPEFPTDKAEFTYGNGKIVISMDLDRQQNLIIDLANESIAFDIPNR